MPDFKKQKLSDCIDYVNEKINIEELNDLNYISTENMLPNRGGITKSSGLPNANYTQCFSEGDILLSNIRPYFKKIWYATFNGGCSNDVLVLRAKSNMYSKFLYYVLSDDKFFEYDTATSKGTKMPRGDKVAIMKYGVPQYDLPKQKKIARILSSLDDKIELNNKINQNLEQQAQAIFDKFFGKCQIGIKTIGNYLTPKRGKNLLSKDAKQGNIPVIAGGLNPATYHNIANTLAPVITISASGANAGYVNLWNIPVWASDSSYIDTTINPYIYFWYILLKNRQKEIYDNQTGSAQPHIYPKHIEQMAIFDLNIANVKNYNDTVQPLFKKIGINLSENEKLAQLRDTLLPKLMNGEIDVDKVEV